MASIYRRGNKWRGQVLLGDKRISITGRTKKEVETKLSEAITEYNKGDYIFEESPLVTEWLDMWLEQKESVLNISTYESIKSMFNVHVYPYVQGLRLEDLTKKKLESIYRKSFPKEKYASGTVAIVKQNFSACLDKAVKEGVISKNPHTYVETQKYREPKKIHAYTRDEQAKIIEYCKYKDSNFNIYYFLIASGVRIGEACALTWDDVDFDKHSVNINKTVVRTSNGLIVQDHTKTRKGMRTIYLPDNTVRWLQEVYDRQDHDKNIMNLVFPTRTYTLSNPGNVLERWHRACVRMDIPSYSLHSLRHTWATRALEENINVKTVSAMLGHKNVLTTMNIYQEVLNEHKQEEVKKINALF